MPKKGQSKGTPSRRAEFIAYLRDLGEGDEHIYWPWSEHRDRYARIFVNGEKIAAHRWVFSELFGPLERHATRGAIGDDLVLHRCDVKGCLRPSHLYLGGALQNGRDASERGQRKKRLSDQDVDRIRDLHEAGVKSVRLAAAFGVSSATISDIVHGKTRLIGTRSRASYPAPTIWAPGRAKLTAEDVYRIRRLADQGAIQTHLAKEYGVSQVAINRIARRLVWKHLPEKP